MRVLSAIEFNVDRGLVFRVDVKFSDVWRIHGERIEKFLKEVRSRERDLEVNQGWEGLVQQMHSFLGVSTTQIREVQEEWFSSRRVRNDFEGFLVDSTLEELFGWNPTCVPSKDVPLGLRKRSSKRILLRRIVGEG